MNKIKIIGAIGLAVFSLSQCKTEKKSENALLHDKTPYLLDGEGFPPNLINPDNQLTVQGVLLGRMLFYEKQLSADATMSCASCHHQQFAFTDTARFSTGIRGQKGGRNAMSVFNMAWHGNEFFWDGRSHLLRDQALKPIQDELEMDESLSKVVTKLSALQSYKDQFMRAFGSNEINEVKISLALEQFMNSIVSNKSKYDQFLKDSTVYSSSEKRGRNLFFKEYNPFFPNESGADCAHCHSGVNFQNNQYMNNGLDDDMGMKDIGRQSVTNNQKDKGKFKVTSLRNIEITGPYMHDGRFKTLEEVVEHYNSGLKLSSTLDPALEQTRPKGLGLTNQDKIDLVNFLKTLTDNELRINKKYSNPF
jgi:cytochrome c peroxidase